MFTLPFWIIFGTALLASLAVSIAYGRRAIHPRLRPHFGLVVIVFVVLALISFFVAHVFYIIGLNPTLPPLGSVIVLIVVAALGVMLYMRIAASLRQKGEEAMRVPVGAYAAILSLMLFSAWATLFRPAWPAAARLTAILGATLFFISDSMLAWNKFVAPSHVMRVGVMVTYHLAQFALAATIALS